MNRHHIYKVILFIYWIVFKLCWSLIVACFFIVHLGSGRWLSCSRYRGGCRFGRTPICIATFKDARFEKGAVLWGDYI